MPHLSYYYISYGGEMGINRIKLSPQNIRSIKGFLKRASHHMIYFAISELKVWFYHRFMHDHQQRYEAVDENRFKRLWP